MTPKRHALCAATALTGLLLTGCGGGGGGSSSPQPTTITGALQPSDKTFGAGGPYVVFYSGAARDTGTATVSLHSPAFAPLLMVGLMDSAGAIHTISAGAGTADGAPGPGGITESFSATKGTTYFFAASSATGTSAQPAVTGAYTLTFSSLLQNVQPDGTITANVRGASARAASGDWVTAGPIPQSRAR